MAPLRRTRAAKPPAAAKPDPTSESTSSSAQTVAPAAVSNVPQERIVIELDSESPFVDTPASDNEVVLCEPPRTEPTTTKGLLSAPTPTPNTDTSPKAEMSDASPVTRAETSNLTQDNSKPGTLKATTQEGQGATASFPSKESPPIEFYAVRGRAGTNIIDEVINDLHASCHCYWMGDPATILAKCTWRANGRSNVSTLQHKPDAQGKPGDGVGDALVGFIGFVASERSTMSPDAGYQNAWGFDGLPKQKRTIRLMSPGVESQIPPSFWNKQWEGAQAIVENGRQLSGAGLGQLGNCFVEADLGTLRVRSPIFEPMPSIAEEDESSDELSPKPEQDTPPTHRYATWNIAQDVRESFNQVIERGYEPQILEAYSRTHKLIHPNDVPAHLAGAVALVYCTLERAVFSSRGNRSRSTPEWQFYANLVKIQVLAQPAPPKSILSTKRKRIPGYGAENQYDPYNAASTRRPSNKGEALARVLNPVN